MHHLFLIATAIFIFIATRNIYKRNFELLLIVLVIINFEFFHLVHVLRFSTLYRLIIVPILLITFIEFIMQKKLVTGKYGGWVLMFFVLLVLGILISALEGQPIILGIKAVKFYSLMLIYFYVVNHKVDTDKFIKYLLILALTIAGLAVMQVILQGYLEIFSTRNSDMLRKYRIIEGSFLIAAAVTLAFANYLKSRKKFYLYTFIALLAHLVFIVQTRMLIAGAILTCIIVYFIYHKFSFKAIAAFMFVSLVITFVVVPYVSFSELTIVERTVADLDNSAETGSTILARVETYKYYLTKLAESPVFGHGFRYLLWRGNEEFLMQRKGLHLSDVGIMGFAIKTGIVGLTWLMIGLMRFVAGIIKGKELTTVGVYIILGVTTLATIDLFMSENAIFMFGLFLGLMSNEKIGDQSEVNYAHNSQKRVSRDIALT